MMFEEWIKSEFLPQAVAEYHAGCAGMNPLTEKVQESVDQTSVRIQMQ